MNTGIELFLEIETCHTAQLQMQVRYSRLQGILKRIIIEKTHAYTADYSGVFSRLFALCNYYNFPIHDIDRFRIHAYKILKQGESVEEQTYLYDLKAICEFVEALYMCKIPSQLTNCFPEKKQKELEKNRPNKTQKRIRIMVQGWDTEHIYGYDIEHESSTLLTIYYGQKDVPRDKWFFVTLENILHKGCQINLLSVNENNNILYPRLIIYEPDFLLDVSALSACIKPYGNSPLNYLLNKFSPHEISAPILLGNATNQFMDDCVNEPDETDKPESELYRESIAKNFRDAILEYVSSRESITKTFFDEALKQFKHIRRAVQHTFGSKEIDIRRKDILLEPSFICESLGLRGRMDVLTTDFKRIIELKSGKTGKNYYQPFPQKEHSLQMALYKEILFYNLDCPHDTVRTFLFYSRYPYFFDERSGFRQIQEAISLRNNIIANEEKLRTESCADVLNAITINNLNTEKINGSFFERFLKPGIERVMKPLQECSELERSYFEAFLTFTEREQFLSKIGDNNPDSNRGFANRWNTDTLTKQTTGDILTDLIISPEWNENGVERIRLDYPVYYEEFLPNFREGDAVLLYECNQQTDNVTNKQIIRGNIEYISNNYLTFKLLFKQKNKKIFHTKSTYALEHDAMDSTYTAIYRGLFSFLTASQERRDLLLAQRQPQTDISIRLNGKYLDKEIDDIVLMSKQARDYFLLIGPPGTGKTSVVLRSMVEEFLTDYKETKKNLLLLAYTNRAVDEICETLEKITPTPTYIRIGQELNCSPSFRHRLLPNVLKNATNRAEVSQCIESVSIFVSTIASLNAKKSLFSLKTFDTAIIDEASQVLEPQLMGLLCFQTEKQCAIRKFILIGDHKQLPAVVLQRPEESVVKNENLRKIGLFDRRNSLFERLHYLQRNSGKKGFTAMLHKQGRMHKDICSFVNTFFYEGKLDVIPLKHQKCNLPFTLSGESFEDYVATTRFGFLPVHHPPLEDNNKINRSEATMVAKLVKCIIHIYQRNGIPFNPSLSIGIIVPFRNQIAMVRKEIARFNMPNTENITIDTVECYQGSQRDIILFSTTISQTYQLEILSNLQEIDGLLIDRKLNVALTRAREQLFILGNPRLLQQNSLYKSLIGKAKRYDPYYLK